MSGTTQAKKCCCGCWYRIPICPCEPDDEQFPLYMPCAIMEAFFEARPELGGHLVFRFWDGSNWLCYDAQLDPAFIVHVIPAPPPTPIVLLDFPPEDHWYPPPFDDCIFCCPNACCPACWGAPDRDACCWHPDDTLTSTVTWEGHTKTHKCCLPEGGIERVVCQPGYATCDYDMAGCDACGVLWVKRAPQQCSHDPTDCLWSWWLYVCYPCDLPGCWTNSEDMECGGPCDGPMVCADLLPLCCPPENEPHACTLVVSDDHDGCSCNGFRIQWDCEYPKLIDCPNWGGGGVPPSWPPPPDWGNDLCVCGNERWKYELTVSPSCQFVGGAYPSGFCVPEDPGE